MSLLRSKLLQKAKRLPRQPSRKKHREALLRSKLLPRKPRKMNSSVVSRRTTPIKWRRQDETRRQYLLQKLQSPSARTAAMISGHSLQHAEQGKPRQRKTWQTGLHLRLLPLLLQTRMGTAATMAPRLSKPSCRHVVKQRQKRCWLRVCSSKPRPTPSTRRN